MHCGTMADLRAVRISPMFAGFGSHDRPSSARVVGRGASPRDLPGRRLQGDGRHARPPGPGRKDQTDRGQRSARRRTGSRIRVAGKGAERARRPSATSRAPASAGRAVGRSRPPLSTTKPLGSAASEPGEGSRGLDSRPIGDRCGRWPCDWLSAVRALCQISRGGNGFVTTTALGLSLSLTTNAAARGAVDSATDFGSVGRGFESLRAGHS